MFVAINGSERLSAQQSQQIRCMAPSRAHSFRVHIGLGTLGFRQACRIAGNRRGYEHLPPLQTVPMVANYQRSNRSHCFPNNSIQALQEKSMRKHLAVICAVAIAFPMIGASSAPAISAPVYRAPIATPDTSTSVIEVKDRKRRHYRGHRAHRYKSYRPRRHHPRRSNNNAGAFIGGLAAGAIIGSVLANQARPSRVYRPAPTYRSAGNAHVDWCYSRYRSYDARTDTFQPYHGPRRYCNSPYR